MKMAYVVLAVTVLACVGHTRAAEPVVVSISYSPTNDPRNATAVDYKLLTAILDGVLKDNNYTLYLEPSILRRYHDGTSWANEKAYLKAALDSGTLNPQGDYDPGIIWKDFQKNQNIRLLTQQNVFPLKMHFKVHWRLVKGSQSSSAFPALSSPIDIGVPDVVTTLMNSTNTIWRDEYQGSLPRGSNVPADYAWDIVNLFRDHLVDVIAKQSKTGTGKTGLPTSKPTVP